MVLLWVMRPQKARRTSPGVATHTHTCTHGYPFPPTPPHQAVSVGGLVLRFTLSLAFNAKIGLAARALAACGTELIDFAVVAVATIAVLGFLVTVLFGPVPPPGGPESVEEVQRGMSYLMLVYVTPSTVVTYSMELLQGMPSDGGGPWEELSGLWMATTVIAKFAFPCFTAWTLKKVSNCKMIS